jgi:hypothetical protein
MHDKAHSIAILLFTIVGTFNVRANDCCNEKIKVLFHTSTQFLYISQ